VKAEIELGGLAVEMETAHLEIAEPRGRGRQHLQHYREERTAIRVALKRQLFEQDLERHIRVRERI